MLTRVVKVPIRIAEDNKGLRLVKYRALNELMHEVRYLGNMAIRYTIAFRLKHVPKEMNEGKPIPIDTRIYRILTGERKFVPTAVLSTLARNYAGKLVRNTDRDAWAGRKSLPTFRSLFVPIPNQDTKIREINDNKQRQFHIEPTGFRSDKWLSEDLMKKVLERLPNDIDISQLDSLRDQYKLSFISCFSWKDTGAIEIVSKIVKGEYKLCDSQLKKNEKGEFALLLTYKFEKKPIKLNPQKVCGIDLGVTIPAVCAVNFGPQRIFVGYGDVIHAARAKHRAERRRHQRRLGLYSRSCKWERSEKEYRWIHTHYHVLTRKIINFCKQEGCGKVHIEDLRELRQKDLKSEYKRLMWVPSKFFNMLHYKAKEEGIEVVKINPRNTSRRCSKCGHIAKENRKAQSRDFVCVHCGTKFHADYNAAKNIALATASVIENGYESAAA